MGCTMNSKTQIKFENFDKHESTELRDLLATFDNHIMKIAGSKNNSYNTFFKIMSEAKTGKEIINISDSLFNVIDIENLLSKSTFSKIWEYRVNKSPDISLESNIQLSLKYNSEYQAFLKKLAHVKGGLIQDYYENFEIGGDLSPSMVAMVQKQSDLLDINDQNVRLVIAIHYLTLAQQQVNFNQ